MRVHPSVDGSRCDEGERQINEIFETCFASPSFGCPISLFTCVIDPTITMAVNLALSLSTLYRSCSAVHLTFQLEYIRVWSLTTLVHVCYRIMFGIVLNWNMYVYEK